MKQLLWIPILLIAISSLAQNEPIFDWVPTQPVQLQVHVGKRIDADNFSERHVRLQVEADLPVFLFAYVNREGPGPAPKQNFTCLTETISIAFTVDCVLPENARVMIVDGRSFRTAAALPSVSRLLIAERAAEQIPVNNVKITLFEYLCIQNCPSPKKKRRFQR